MSATTTLRSRKLMEGEGYHVENTEHYNFFTKRRHDLFGFGDLLCVHKERPRDVVVVQSTSLSNISSRINKITDHDNLPVVRNAEFRIEVHGWSKKKNRWEVRREDLS